jgi:hypothetical protein
MNVTGPETIVIRGAAEALGSYLGKAPVFLDNAGESGLWSDASKALRLFGNPEVTYETLLRWQSEWLLDGGRILGKPTHFEQTKGVY